MKKVYALLFQCKVISLISLKDRKYFETQKIVWKSVWNENSSKNKVFNPNNFC